MKKKLLVFFLSALLLVPNWCMRTTHAANSELNLYFENNQAHCNAYVQGSGRIEVRMGLWHGNTEIISWQASDYFTLSMSKECSVVPGYSYTLKLNGTVGGVAIQEISVYRTNWEMNK